MAFSIYSGQIGIRIGESQLTSSLMNYRQGKTYHTNSIMLSTYLKHTVKVSLRHFPQIYQMCNSDLATPRTLTIAEQSRPQIIVLSLFSDGIEQNFLSSTLYSTLPTRDL